jgi:23S rRNA pseudouridine2605 synthase
MRLNQYLAQVTGFSRRGADLLIQEGKVSVNNQPAKLGVQVGPSDEVRLEGRLLSTPQHLTIMFNKPIGVVTSRRQQGDTPTIYAQLPERLRRLKPVGRLDKDSSGLLILTSDGELAQRLSHPSRGKWKRYEIQTDRPLTKAQLKEITQGIELEDGASHMQVTPLNTGYQVRLQEGRNRQIRRTIAALGRTVVQLHRTDLGSLSLGSLGVGEWREMRPEELAV